MQAKREMKACAGFSKARWIVFGSGGSIALLARRYAAQKRLCQVWNLPSVSGQRTDCDWMLQACNPYGFLYPQQNYPPYKRVPAAGILDNKVRLGDVAPQILDSMFAESLPSNTTGLLVSLDFNMVDNGLVFDSSSWLPEECSTCGNCFAIVFLDVTVCHVVPDAGRALQEKRSVLAARRSAYTTSARTSM